MRHVILFNLEDEEPASELAEALRAAGISATRLRVNAEEPGGELPPLEPPEDVAPFAVLFEVDADTDLAALRSTIDEAASVWPRVPIVACRRTEAFDGRGAAQWFDESTLKRLGFHAVSAGPAQLAAVLREVEERGAALEERASEPASIADLAPASLLLPERLSTERLRAAFETVAALHFAADQKGAAATALAGLASLVAADRWTLYLVNETGKVAETLFEPLAVRGLTESERALPEDDWRRSFLGDPLALVGSQSHAAREAVETAETVRRREGAHRRVVAVPLVAGERVTGVLEAVREGANARQFSSVDLSLLSALSLPLAAALSNSARVAEAERLSQTDDLTKLHNARHLRQYLISEFKRARRYNSLVTAVFFDLDDFKQINDRHGHLVGSHVLMEMASVILSSVRDTDVVARYGGDEFVVILPETGIEQGICVAHRVRERISRHAFTGGRNLRLKLTASFGVAAFPQHAQSPHQLIAAADTAMYEAKAAQKNCVRLAAETAQ